MQQNNTLDVDMQHFCLSIDLQHQEYFGYRRCDLVKEERIKERLKEKKHQ